MLFFKVLPLTLIFVRSRNDLKINFRSISTVIIKMVNKIGAEKQDLVNA
jgi:hypothetical protein